MAEFANPDHARLHAFLAAPAQPLAMDTNPLLADLGAQLHEWDAGARLLTLRFRPGARHLQGKAVVQGGIVTTMLDFGLAFCVLALLDASRTAATVALNVHFERAVQAGELEVRAWTDRLGGRLAFASAELAAADGGDVLARATATLALTA